VQPPFTTAQFFDVFRAYNEAVWPVQWVLALAALAAIWFALRGGVRAGWVPSGILAVLWLWAGAVYHLAYFGAINRAAVAFGVLFIVEAGLLAWFGVVRRRLIFHPHADGAGIAGSLLLVYALVLYPVLGYAAGHRYPSAPTFGLPCPITIFTFGLLLWCESAIPRSLLLIPALWAVVSTSAVATLGVYEDAALLVGALIATPMLLMRAKRISYPRMRNPKAHGVSVIIGVMKEKT
jgi:hypothetical protein